MLLQRKSRPGLFLWRHDHNLTLRATAALLEAEARALGHPGFTCSDETVRLICLPFDHPRRRVPSGPLIEAIVSLTKAEIGEGHFHPEAQAAA